MDYRDDDIAEEDEYVPGAPLEEDEIPDGEDPSLIETPEEPETY